MDIVYLHGLRCQCRVGVWAWEKQVEQSLILDLDLGVDAVKAAANDDLQNALDYQAVAQRVQKFAADNQFDLIETLAERLAKILLDEFKTTWVRIKVDKGQAVKGVQNVGLVIERSSN